MAYAELFCQSNFSFLQGASHPQELVQQAHFLGYEAIAITDECSVAGVVRAYTEIKDHQLGIKLIVGSYFTLDNSLSCVLLCPTREAYGELCRIITNARRRSPKGEYALAKWDLKTIKHCFMLWLPNGDMNLDEPWAIWLKKHYQDRLWIGAQRHLTANEHTMLAHYKKLSRLFDLPICACGGVLMHNPSRQPLQHLLSAIKQRSTVAELGRALISNSERSLRSQDKLNKLFKRAWLDSSVEIARRCSFNMKELRYEYPAELIPSGKTPKQYLRELVESGIQKRFPEGIKADVREIIEKELILIEEQEYEFFFLTIYDVVQFAQSQQILYQGRGSAANSVVCYCLEITSVDPRQINVLFERFISKERDEPPDIDVDFEHQRREEVIQYIYNKYGRERTAIAATVSCYRFKSALREVGKALGINETQLDFFIKNINRRDSGLNWQAQIAELGLDPASQKGKHFISLVNEIMGFPRHLSQHVGGFIISSGPLYQLVPIENAAMADRSVIQWDKDDLESLGLLKVDVLALGMLTAIRKSFQLIETHYQHTLSIAQITKLEDDPQVYGMIQKADTVGVFQIESRAQMSMLPRLKPKTYYDLVIQIAIVRPGPIQGDMVHPFLRRRDGKEPIEYPSEEVAGVLSRTMGVPIFQEQVIQLAMVAAGFTGGEADQLRRAMASWKKTGQLMQFQEKLINGMLKRGYTQDYAERIFNQICGFGEYGFPESHSASFAVLAYVSSWLKYYYPEAFYVGLLNSWPMGFYPPAQLVQDAKRHQIKVLPICINHSDYEHILEKAEDTLAIRLGLRMIKGLSNATAQMILEQRPKDGYTSVVEIKQLAIRSDQIEALASANALSGLATNRYKARWALMETETELPLLKNQEQTFLFDVSPSEVEEMVEDYAATSLSLTRHPIQLLRNAGKLGRYTAANQLADKEHKSVVNVIGVVIGRQAPGTAAGVTFMTLEDDTGCSNVVVWQATARAQKKAFLKSKIIKVSGILERGDGDVTHIIAGKITDLSHLLEDLNTSSRDFH
ncbi:error-prone DNA polymerase [Aliiglaciecola lipolytica]|uniref:Error-prone DNA polymerase n=1 Tax=Aliiglaciecola lipolytica E3 TaxID=1127673 RepID=K6X495_9ALTE|nr:error-prone DNA polymerase [Aliiglaciecola lipolytica]GAC15444.1 error-prone DNA polymerase [Aliiglaciecola lipolytica E3]